MADLASNSTAFYFLVGIFGLCLGSFANVAALRSLDGRDWISAPSSCFACDRRLGWSENMPIYGFLRRGGKCACGERTLPRRYVLVELAMAAALLAVTGVAKSWQQQRAGCDKELARKNGGKKAASWQ